MHTDPTNIRASADLIGRWKFVSFLVVLAGCAFSKSLCSIGIGGYLAGVLLQAASGKPYDWVAFPKPRLFLPLLASLVISVFVSSYFSESVRGLLKYLQGFILLYAGSDVIRTRAHLRQAMGAFFLVAAVAVLDGLSQQAFGTDFIYGRAAIPYLETGLRITGPFKHSNDYATFLVPAFLATFALGAGLWRTGKKAAAAMTAVALCPFAYVILRTMSRSAVLSLFAAFLCFALFSKRKFFWLGLIAGGLCLVFILPSDIGARMKSIFDLRYGNNPERLALVETAARMTLHHPLFGLGLNTYSRNFDAFKPAGYKAAMYAHNTYLQMSAEAGIVGLLFFLAYLAAFVREYGRAVGRGGGGLERFLLLGILSGIVAFLVNGLFESCLQSTNLRSYFWWLMGLAWALAREECFAS